MSQARFIVYPENPRFREHLELSLGFLLTDPTYVSVGLLRDLARSRDTANIIQEIIYDPNFPRFFRKSVEASKNPPYTAYVEASHDDGYEIKFVFNSGDFRAIAISHNGEIVQVPFRRR